MSKSSIRTRTIGLYVSALIVILSEIGRAAPEFRLVKFEWAVYWGPLFFLALYVTERFITKKIPIYPTIYFIIQSLLTLVLLQLEPTFDAFALQFVLLCIQAVWITPRRSALIWVGVFCLLTLGGLMLDGVVEGITYSLGYIAVSIFVAYFGVVTLDAEKARNETQKLLTELQVAHSKLKGYAEQVEELAAIQQRNMLARELHDSVTQTIFSMTLTAQAARMLLDRDPTRVAGQLEHLQELSQNALGEMRSLIQQMRPRAMAEEGLVEALRRHCADRQKNDGLSIDLRVSGNQRLPLQAEEGLFRIIQEALNNIVKHAGDRQATVTLDLREAPFSAVIEDHGKGFDPHKVNGSTEHIGLTSMAERARSIGGTLSVESSPGAGTCIRIDGIRPQEAGDG